MHDRSVKARRVIEIAAVDDGHESKHELPVTAVLEFHDLMRLHQFWTAHRSDLWRSAVGHDDTDQLRTSPMVTGIVSLTSMVKRNTCRARRKFSGSKNFSFTSHASDSGRA